MIYFLFLLFRWDTFVNGCSPTHCWSPVETGRVFPE